jgi:hypothetical protein
MSTTNANYLLRRHFPTQKLHLFAKDPFLNITALHIEPIFRLRRYSRRKLCKDTAHRASEENCNMIAHL